MNPFEELLTDAGVEWIDSGQNSSKDFINICCSDDFGGCAQDAKFKLGIHRSGKFCHCWACGSHSIKAVVSSLGIDWKMWKQAIDEEEDVWDNIALKDDKKDYVNVAEIKDIMIPGEELHEVHKQYLRERGFDPSFLEEEFGLQGITYNGNYYQGTEFYKEDLKLQYRIIIPIYYKGKAISYIGRTYRKDVENRYMCALPNVESYHHKHAFFNLDRVTGRKVILCEGTFDVMKLVQASRNFNIIASYGTAIKDEQLTLLRTMFDKVIILFDGEEKAQTKALYIKTYMESYEKKATNICLKGGLDPGDLDLPTAKYLVNALLGEEDE